MAVIKLIEDYAVSQLRKDVRDALTLAGEQAILLQLFHVGDTDAVACPECGDDIYKSPEHDCTVCYGTMFEGGVRQSQKVWTLFTDKAAPEQLGARGDFQPDQRSVQFEAFPLVVEHDVIVRVRSWAADGNPAELEGYYMLGIPQRRSLRTGSRFGQYGWDVVGQKAQISELPESMKMITQYPIQVSPAPSAPVISEPEVAVVYYPYQPEPHAEDIGDGINIVFSVNHGFATRDVTVTVFDNTTGEEVTPDVVRTTINTVLVKFGTPPAPDGFRVVVKK